MAGISVSVVFDFDETIIDCDSDKWVVDEMGVTSLFNELHSTMPWNSLMNKMMEEIHSQGKTIEEIADCLRRIPLHPQIITAIKAAYAFGCDLKIVSDANVFFIETVFKDHGIFDCFLEINTNPSLVDGNGRLRIFPCHDFTSSHGYNLCPSNMCKGSIIERIRASLASAERKTRFIYVGDGKGDFCPSTKLREGDYVMPRKNFPLWTMICTKTTAVKAEAQEWCDAEELNRILIHLVKTLS